MKRLILELGGKSVQLYLPDAVADGPAKAVGGALAVFFAHAGQGCSLQTRMLVPREQVANRGRRGGGGGRGPDGRRSPGGVDGRRTGRVGFLTRADRTTRRRRGARRVGASVCGGRWPGHLERGYFYEPTLVEVDDNRNPLAQHEIFGPVVTVQGYRDLDEAIAIRTTPSTTSPQASTRRT